MSSKGTIFLTTKGDHWYEDFSTLSPSSKIGHFIPNLHISIGIEDIIEAQYDNVQKTYFLEIDGNSELANCIRKARR